MRKFSVIWNVTKLCFWDCPFCCVDALYIGKRKALPNDLKNTNELTFEEKIHVINELSKLDCRLDFSGGELLLNDENIELLAYASKKLKRENIGISVSGVFIDENMAQLLSHYVSEVEITMDCVPGIKYPLRPSGYHECAAQAIQNLKKYDVEVGIQTVLTKDNISQNALSDLFNWILDNHVDSWSLLRFFPSGRGAKFAEKTPTYSEYCNTVDFISRLTENKYSGVHFQYLLPNHQGTTLNCRAGKQSMGILQNGDCVSCFWGLTEGTQVKDKKFLIGNIIHQSIEDILFSKETDYWRAKSECVVFEPDQIDSKKLLNKGKMFPQEAEDISAYNESNKKRWDELAITHLEENDYYSLERFLKTKMSLKNPELKELGDITGKSLLHLQCHNGMDSISWSELGANVIGVDYSEKSIEVARDLAKTVDSSAKFVLSDIYKLNENLPFQFDIITSTYGTLLWLNDLDRWAQIIVSHLNPNGIFYLVDYHPVANMLSYSDSTNQMVQSKPYFYRNCLNMCLKTSYTNGLEPLQNQQVYIWRHTIGNIVSALSGAGLYVDFLHEFTFMDYERFPGAMEKKENGWEIKGDLPKTPLLFSLMARRNKL